MDTRVNSSRGQKLDQRGFPTIVCLCGSTKFRAEFEQANKQETMKGNIVLTVGCFPRLQNGVWDYETVTIEQKVELDLLHLRKIELADEILVLNVGGYIGPSTSNEIRHAKLLGKPIRYLVS